MRMTLTLAKEMIKESPDQGNRSQHERLEECRKRFSLRCSRPTVVRPSSRKGRKAKENEGTATRIILQQLLDPHSLEIRAGNKIQSAVELTLAAYLHRLVCTRHRHIIRISRAIRIRGALQRLAVLHAMSLNLQPVHVARTGRRIIAIRTPSQRDAIVEQPGLVERILELHDGAQAGCFRHLKANVALNAGRAEGLYMLTFRWDGDGVGGDSFWSTSQR